METEIYTYYHFINNKRKFFEDLTNQLADEFLKQEHTKRIPIKKVEGCKYLHVVNFKDLTDWSVRGLINIENELSVVENMLIKKIVYMCGSGHTSFADAINMLKRIATKGMKGCLNGKGKCYDGELAFADRGEEETTQEYINRVAIGHCYHEFTVWTLTDQDVISIRKVLERNNLLN